MKMLNFNMRSTAIAALLSFPLAGGAAFAQQSQETDQTDQSATSSQDTAQQQSPQSATGSGQMAGDQQADAVVATVGDAEIRGSDVMTVIGMLPPQLQSQPPQMLVPMALEQLILRELILEEARGQNLANDPEVVALVESSAQTAEEDAMVQVWLDREMASAVTDDAVQQIYEGLQANTQDELPAIEQMRPQVEQHLRQQAMQDIQMRLREGAEVVLYDPSGQPLDPQPGTGTEQDQNQSGGGQAQTTGTEQPQSDTSQSGETESGQPQNN